MSRILVIDDEPAIGENIQRLLRSLEVNVTAFQDPAKGLSATLANPPDLVLLDMRMPGISGEEVFTRTPRSSSRIPVIFLTAFGSVEGAVAAMRTGAFDYLQKPFKREELTLAVNRALSHATLKQEIESPQGPSGSSGRDRLCPEPQPRHAGTDREVPACGRHRCNRDDLGRKRHWQGSGGAIPA